MSEKEMQEIISQLFETLKSNSLTIDELLHTNVLKGEDYVELNQGRKASLSDIKSYIARSEENCIDVLKKKDERIPSDNNVFSSIRTLLELANNNELLKKMFLRKDQSDFTRHLLHFLGGLAVGDNGSGISVLPDGKSQAVVDYLYVKVKAIFDELEVKKKTYVGGEQILSPAGMKCIRVEELTDVYRCFFKAEEDGIEIENQFTPGTLAISQECNIKVGVSHNVGNRYYWREVTAVGVDYIDLSKTKCDPNIENDIPAAGDDIVALGHDTDITRQGAIVLSSVNEVAPSIIMYQGIDSFSLDGKEAIGFDYDKSTGRARMRVYGDAYIGAKDRSSYVEYTDEGGVDIKGIVHIENGSTGAGNLTDLPDEVQKAVDLGSVNLLRNSGFTGQYENEELSPDTVLSPDSELYNNKLSKWTGIATVSEDTEAVSGYSITLGSLSQNLKLIIGENYVVSYKGMGTSLVVSCGNYNVVQPLTAERTKYVHKFKFAGNQLFLISGTAVLCDLKLERGSIATDWMPSPLDNDKAMAEMQALSYIQDAIRDGSVDMIGGLMLANMIMTGSYKDGKMQKVTAGMSGIYNDDDDVAFWAGGKFEQAIRAVMYYKENPTATPTEEELKLMAKFVVTHGGRAILNDVIVRGYVYALGGMFKGKIITSFDGKRIEIDPETNSLCLYTSTNKEVVRLSFYDIEGQASNAARVVVSNYDSNDIRNAQAVLTGSGIRVSAYNNGVLDSRSTFSNSGASIENRDGSRISLMRDDGLLIYRDGKLYKSFT